MPAQQLVLTAQPANNLAADNRVSGVIFHTVLSIEMAYYLEPGLHLDAALVEFPYIAADVTSDRTEPLGDLAQLLGQ